MKGKAALFALLILLMAAIPLVAAIGNEPQAAGTPSAVRAGAAVQTASSPAESTQETIKLFDVDTGKVSTLLMKDYLIGVAACEMPIEFHTEALKAQVVAAHTYAVRIKAQNQASENPALKGADVTNDSTTFQGFLSREQLKKRWGKNFDVYYQKLAGIVRSEERR